jgi:protein-arginine kinase activator protein McsA
MVKAEIRLCPGCRKDQLFFNFTQSTGLCDTCYVERHQALKRAYRKLQNGVDPGRSAPVRHERKRDLLELAEMDSD